jgi:hypothetical protein
MQRGIRRSLPILRLPTPVFPRQCVSLRIIPESDGMFECRPPPGSLSKGLADEIATSFAGQVALLGHGSRTGVLVDIGGAEARRSDSLAGALPGPCSGWDGGMAAHCIGGERVQLLETGERTRAGGRLAAFEDLHDDQLTADMAVKLDEEAGVARALLDLRAERDSFELLLCTLDDEVGLEAELAVSHPKFLQCAVQPEDPHDLSFWCAARLPLTTLLRQHLLHCSCPLKRMRDVVDVMRLLVDPSRDGRLSTRKFHVVYDTAEASGCELEPPKAIVDWAGGDERVVARY